MGSMDLEWKGPASDGGRGGLGFGRREVDLGEVERVGRGRRERWKGSWGSSLRELEIREPEVSRAWRRRGLGMVDEDLRAWTEGEVSRRSEGDQRELDSSLKMEESARLEQTHLSSLPTPLEPVLIVRSNLRSRRIRILPTQHPSKRKLARHIIVVLLFFTLRPLPLQLQPYPRR